MAIQNRFGLRNPLLRHVRRHANTTTLFRQPNDGAPSPGAVYTAWPVGVLPSAPVADESVRDAAIAQAESVSAAPPIRSTAGARPTAVTVPPVISSAPAQPMQRTAVPQPDHASSTPPAKDDDWPEWGRLESIARRHQVRRAAETTPQEGPTAVPQQSTSADTVSRAVAAAESMAAPAEPTPGRLPLESVWPVRREPAPASVAASPPPAPTAASPLPSGPVLPDQEEALVRAKLEDVHSGRASGSSIELHLPRRPRPDRPPQSQPQPAGPPAVQRTADPPAQDAAPSEAPPSLVETSIGPLPADMWEILGQEPPASQPSPPAGEAQAAIAAAESRPASAASATAVPAALGLPLASSPLQTAVQRTLQVAKSGSPAAHAVEAAKTAAPAALSSPSTADTAVQRAIPAAETAVPSIPSPAPTAAEAPPRDAALETEVGVATASPTPGETLQAVPAAPISKPSPDASVQRATAAVENAPPEAPTALETAVPTAPISEPAPVDSVQRAIATVESAPPEAQTALETAVPTAPISEPSPDASVQQAIAAVENASPEAQTALETALPAAPISEPAPIDSVQQAIAAAEAPPDNAASVRPAPPIRQSTPDVVRRAVLPHETMTTGMSAAVETPGAESSATPPAAGIIQRAVVAAEAPPQGMMAAGETAVTPAQSPPPPAAPPIAQVVHRAAAAAEAPPQETANAGETAVKPAQSSAAPAAVTIQRAIPAPAAPPQGTPAAGKVSETSVTPAQSPPVPTLPPIVEVVQRAAAAAEAPSDSRAAAPPPIIQLKSGAYKVAEKTAVRRMAEPAPAPDSGARPVAAPRVVAEMDTQPSLPSPGNLAVEAAEPASQPAAAETVQRAIAAAEAGGTSPAAAMIIPAAGSPFRVQAQLAVRRDNAAPANRSPAAAPTAAGRAPMASAAPWSRAEESTALFRVDSMARPGATLPSLTPSWTPPWSLPAQASAVMVQRATAVAEAPPSVERTTAAAFRPATVSTTPPVTKTAVAKAETFAENLTVDTSSVSTDLAQRQPHHRQQPAAVDHRQPPPAIESLPLIESGETLDESDYAALSDLSADMCVEMTAESETAVDVEELARQVYQKLRRRLAVERERERGRL